MASAAERSESVLCKILFLPSVYPSLAQWVEGALVSMPSWCGEIWDLSQNIIALPVPYQDRFRKKCSNFREQTGVEKRSKMAPQKRQKIYKNVTNGSVRKAFDFIQEFVDSGGPKSFQSIVNSSKIACSPTSEKRSNFVTFWSRFRPPNRNFSCFGRVQKSSKELWTCWFDFGVKHGPQNRSKID